MTERDDLELIAVRIQRKRRPELSTSMLSRIVQQSKPELFSRWFDKGAERSYQQYFQWPVFSVLLASAFFGTKDETSPGNSSHRDFN